jgi:uncharacterized membrane protein
VTARSPLFRLAVAVLVGAAAAALAGRAVGSHYVPPIGWITGATVFLGWSWWLLRAMDGAETRSHANDWDSSSQVAHLSVLTASLASLEGVGYLLSGKTTHDLAAAAVGVLSVAASWFTIHTFFMLRYARLYYGTTDPPIDFNQDGLQPTYHDFAYLAFTIGMTYQVSDTEIGSTEVRRTVLSQALLSFFLGAIIIAITLNLVVSLAG